MYLQIQGQPGLHREFQNNQSYIETLCLTNIRLGGVLSGWGAAKVLEGLPSMHRALEIHGCHLRVLALWCSRIRSSRWSLTTKQVSEAVLPPPKRREKKRR